jgi:hypothetical protein
MFHERGFTRHTLKHRVYIHTVPLKHYLKSSPINYKLIKGEGEFNADVFVNPDKYSVSLPIQKIVADNKVSRQGVEIYKQKIINNEEISPVIVVKHPRKDLYAVLDGHHRFYAFLEMGKKEINCAPAGDYSSVIFYLTEHGYFQPSPEVTKNIRQPVVKLHQNLKQFLTNFVSDIT